VESLERVPPTWDGHLLLVHRSEQERRAGVAAWVTRGLEVGAKIVYAEPPGQSPDRSLMAVLNERRVDTGASVTRGQLQVLPPEHLYSPAQQVHLIEQALAEGYPSVRFSAEAHTAYTVVSPAAHADLEWAMERLCRVRPVSALCQYPADLTLETLQVVSAMHVDGIWQTHLRTAARPDGIVLAGEADVSNQQILRSAVMAATTLARRSFVVDLSLLDFLDVGGCRALLLGTADYRRDGGRVLLQAPQRRVDRLLRLLAVDREQGVNVDGNDDDD